MMKILVISDVHSNLNALEAVLKDAGEFDAIWFLGDLVGYGPDPNECIARVRGLPNLVGMMGNHDIAVLNEIDVRDFNQEARQAIVWTQSVLTPENQAYLTSLSDMKVEGQFTLVHGSPRYPIWEYLMDVFSARSSFEHYQTDFCLVGHTHIPVIFQQQVKFPNVRLESPLINQKIDLQARAILNPGSVGQPRDHNPMAAYAILDPVNLTWECRRVPYDIAAVQARMQAVKLPERHTTRLSAGW